MAVSMPTIGILRSPSWDGPPSPDPTLPPTQPSLRGLQKKSYLRVQFRLIELKFMLTNMIIDLLF